MPRLVYLLRTISLVFVPLGWQPLPPDEQSSTSSFRIKKPLGSPLLAAMSLIRQSVRALKAVNTTAAIRPAVARFSTDGKVHGVPVHNTPTEDAQVVIPEVHQTLEWCLSSPPPIHQFDEAPLVIETYGDVDPYH